MIINEINGSCGVVVRSTVSPTVAYYPVDNSATATPGTLRFNPSRNLFEVFDGTMWQIIIHGSAHVALDSETQSVIDWAREKMREEAELQELIKQSPALRDAKEQFDVVRHLVKNNETL